MKIRLKYIVLCVLTLIIVFTNKAQATTGKVATDTLNLRKEPSTSSSIIKLLNDGDKIEIISDEGDWYKVKHGENEGYVSKEYVKVDEGENQEQPTITTPTEPTAEPTPTEPTTQPSTNVTPNTTIKLEKDVTIKILPLINSKDLSVAKSGEEVTIITTANNWIFIQTDEIAGWIVKDTSLGQTIQNEDTNQGEDGNTENNNETDNNENNDNNGNGVDNNENDNGNKPDNDENRNETSSGTNYEQAVTKYVNASSVYVRSKATTSSDIVTSLIKNTDVKVTGEDGDWYKVEFNHFKGYIYKELLSDSKIEETNRGNSNRDKEVENTVVAAPTTTATTKGLEIVEYAKQYLNCPYVYGGAGSQSFDCSGFTMYVYKHFGYSLSHSATAQSNNGVYVAKEDLQPGDLVFFLDYETMDGIGHCGIYIGDGNFIHASSGSGYCVKISTLLSGSYYNRYATARRLI